MTTSVTRAAGLCALLATTCLTTPSLLHAATPVAAPPVHQSIDGNGVDLALGTFNLSSVDVSIGPDAARGLAYIREWRGEGWRDNLAATLSSAGGTDIVVSIGGSSDIFALTASGYVAKQANGATLVLNGDYTYTTADGTVAVFAPANGQYDRFVSNLGWARYIRSPNGVQRTFTYLGKNYCPHVLDAEFRTCTLPQARSVRLQSVTNSFGYQLKLSYASNTLTHIEERDAWQQLAKVTAINNAVEPCDPSADTCALGIAWPHATYTKAAAGNEETVADLAGTSKSYLYDAFSRIAAVRRPSGADDLTVSYDAAGRVGTVTNAGVPYGYSWSDAGPVRTAVMTGPLNAKRTVTSSIDKALVLTDADALEHKTTYEYDANDRPRLVTATEGNAVELTYDARGNVTQTRIIAKPGSAAADIMASAGYDVACTNQVTCNKPLSTTDAGGAVTDYSYDPVHGGVLAVTMAAPSAGAVRPQTRYGYTSAGGITQLTSISACRTSSNCAGTADETRTQFVYGPQSANFVPTSASSGSGDGVLTATQGFGHDRLGNLVSVDGPLPGPEDAARRFYDARQRVVGMVGPDPDGTGVLKPRAMRTTYNGDGQATAQESGTVADQTDAAWGAFAPLEQSNATYDANGRSVKQTLTAGAATQAAVEYSYDAKGRLLCTAQRMNPASFGAQADACTPTPTVTPENGGFGPDRISRTVYDAADRVVASEVAVGDQATQATEASATYTPSGMLATLTDGENNKTTYAYDGHGRLSRTLYPVPTKAANASSTTDYEELGYDSRGNVVSRRIRAGGMLYYGYDALSRLTAYDRIGSEPDVSYTYDNLSNLTRALDMYGHKAEFTYDALGRKLSEGNYWYTSNYAYDLAGRRTRMTWGDGVFVGYDYLVTGEMTAIRENGAASGVGVLASFAYDDQGRRTNLTRGNGTSTAYAFDPVSRLASLGQSFASAANNLNLTFAYNPASQITSNTRSNDLYSWTGHGSGTSAYTANGLNQYSQAGAASPTYDPLGNLSSDGSGRTFVHDSDSRLVITNGSRLFYYEPLGRSVHPADNGIHNAYDGPNLITEHASVSGFPVVRRYVHGPGVDEPLVWYEGAGTSDRRFLHADERGSIVAVSDSAGNTIGVNKYDEYGAPASSNIGRFQYTGQRWLANVGLYDYKARMYDPKLRFLEPDPIGYGDGTNRYNYAGGDPINFVDPTGLKKNAAPAEIKHIKRDGIDRQEIVVTYRCKGDCGQRAGDRLGVIASAGSTGRNNGDVGGAGATGSPENDDIIVTAKLRRTTLRNVLPSTLWDHFLDGSGDTVCLTGSQFNTLAGVGKRVGNLAPRAGGGYAQQTSYYGGPYANSFGTATIYLDADRNSVGFHDYYDFDAHGRSSFGAQAKTAVGALGYLSGGKDFSVDYNSGICR